MKNCEHCEMLLSTGIDGQLDGKEQVECLDHVVRCDACRSFYLEARALDGLLAAVRTPAAAEPPSPDVWQRIAWKTRSERKQRRRSPVPAWVLQAAAVLVVAIGLSVTMWNGSIATAPDQAEVLLGQGDEMSEEYFVELTREVLGADPRFHTAMYEIMGQVVRDTTPVGEGSREDVIQKRDEGDEGEGAEVSARIPA